MNKKNRYNDFSIFIRKKFNTRVQKVSINATAKMSSQTYRTTFQVNYSKYILAYFYGVQVAVYFIDGRGSCYRINLD